MMMRMSKWKRHVRNTRNQNTFDGKTPWQRHSYLVRDGRGNKQGRKKLGYSKIN
jgi:hypothetical protein